MELLEVESIIGVLKIISLIPINHLKSEQKRIIEKYHSSWIISISDVLTSTYIL